MISIVLQITCYPNRFTKQNELFLFIFNLVPALLSFRFDFNIWHRSRFTKVPIKIRARKAVIGFTQDRGFSGFALSVIKLPR